MQNKQGELSLAAFAPAEGSKAFQTPYGSLQLAAGQGQHLGYGGLGSAMGGGESDEDEDDDDDDDEGGNKKRKRRPAGSTSSGGSKPGSSSGSKRPGGASANASRPGGGGGPGGLKMEGTAAGERDMHTGRRKIRIEFIEDDSRRHITFSKRKAGIMKKAYELATLTGTQVLLLIVSQTGLVYTFTTPKLSPVVQQAAGRELIQSCLSAPEPGEAGGNGLDGLGNDDLDAGNLPHGMGGPRSEHGTSSTDAHAHVAHPSQQQQVHAAHQGYPSIPRSAGAGAGGDTDNSYSGAFADPRHAALMGMGGNLQQQQQQAQQQSQQQHGAVNLANLPPHLLAQYGYNPMAASAGGNGLGMGMGMAGGQPQLVGHEHGLPYNYGSM